MGTGGEVWGGVRKCGDVWSWLMSRGFALRTLEA